MISSRPILQLNLHRHHSHENNIKTEKKKKKYNKINSKYNWQQQQKYIKTCMKSLLNTSYFFSAQKKVKYLFMLFIHETIINIFI